MRQDAIRRAEAFSPFLRHLCGRHPDTVDHFREKGGDAALKAALANIAADLPTAARLRQIKQQLALVTALADLAGEWPLEKVMLTLSDFADNALDEAVRAAIRERSPDAEPAGFTIIGLGKHGSRELNYSSDLDPIFLYDPNTLPHRPREDVAEAAVRIGRRVIELMQARDADGYVFRMDLRLRPHPEATPVSLPVDAAISYYESAALPWERAAFIRARTAAGDKALGHAFLSAIQPFVWRMSLDFGAIADIQEITRRIRDHHAQVQAFGPGWDIKRGRGGIREVEFHAQILQMIYGGRSPALRAGATLDALKALEAAGRIDSDVAEDLTVAYRLFRTIEHRLQMINDQQTHMIPRDAAAIDRVANLHCLADGAMLLDLLRPHVERTARHYDRLIEASQQDDHLPADRERLEDHLRRIGFADFAGAAERLEDWRSCKARALRSPSARRAFEAILRDFLSGIGTSPDPGGALAHFDRFLYRLSSGAQFFTLLDANPPLVNLLVKLLGFAPSLAETLAARPELIDGLLDASAFEPVPEVAQLSRELAMGSARSDYEALLDGVRRRVAERRFALGVQMVEGMFDPLEIAASHSRLAEAAIVVLAEAATRAFEEAHGVVPGGRLLILGLGRLGGGALTPASDLDLIFLFSGRHDAESNGPRPLGATAYFNRLAQRVVAALTVRTAQGALYEVDTRLRPSGAQGLLAVSMESFAQYQRESAWTWEHMALTRARLIHGDDRDRVQLDAIIAKTLNQPRDEAVLAHDVVAMRQEMAKHKKPAGTLDVKLVPGGLVDLEFVVHFHQLNAGVAFDPRLPQAIVGLAASQLVEGRLGAAHDLLTRLLICRRFLAADAAEPGDVPQSVAALVASACGFADWDRLLAAYADARQCVTRHWQLIVGKEVAT